MEERPHLNPFRDRELQVGKAADRMAAGPQSVKAAKVESAASARDDAFEVLRQWTWVNSMERYRPPPIDVHRPFTRRPRFPQWGTTDPVDAVIEGRRALHGERGAGSHGWWTLMFNHVPIPDHIHAEVVARYGQQVTRATHDTYWTW